MIETIVQRIEEMAKRTTHFEEWEKMRQEAKRRQREDRRLNIFWGKNKRDNSKNARMFSEILKMPGSGI